MATGWIDSQIHLWYRKDHKDITYNWEFNPQAGDKHNCYNLTKTYWNGKTMSSHNTLSFSLR